ncbi:MAG: hypothetical protein AAF430_14450 [Myxococcota bacterium]
MPRPSASRFARVPAWAIAGTTAAFCYAALATRSHAPGGATLSELWVFSACAFVASFALWWRHREEDTDPPLVAVLGFAALFQAIGVAGLPILEDDPYRYLWDAWVFQERGSPYGVAPAAYFDRAVPAPFDRILDQINNPALPTVYGPVCQWLFRAAHTMAPGLLWPLQFFAGAAVLGCCLVVARVVRPRDLLLLAWSPLVVKEFGFTAHTDAFGVLPLLLSIAVRAERPVAAGVLLAIAFGARPFAAVLAPFVLLGSGRAWLAFVVGVVALHAPFFDPALLRPDASEGLRSLAGGWLFNAPLHLLALQVWPGGEARGVLSAAFVIGWCALLHRHVRDASASDWPRGDLVFGALLLFAPVLNPWYALWALAFAPLRPSATAWVASAGLLVSYAHGLGLGDANLAPYEVPAWALFLEFGPIALAFAWDLQSSRRSA